MCEAMASHFHGNRRVEVDMGGGIDSSAPVVLGAMREIHRGREGHRDAVGRPRRL